MNSGTYLGDRDALLHMLDFFDKEWHFKCINALGQAFAATRDQRCLTAWFVHCHSKGDISLDYSQAIVSSEQLASNIVRIFEHRAYRLLCICSTGWCATFTADGWCQIGANF